MVKQRKQARFADGTGGDGSKSKKSRGGSSSNKGPAAPFKPAPEELRPLLETLEEKRVYILHVDGKPAEFKRKIFMVPVAMNIGLVLLFVWRVWYIVPWYLRLLESTLGTPNETTMVAAEVGWGELLPEVARRAAHFALDFVLVVFIWPWPYEFCLGTKHANPVSWRWTVGFRPKEVVARRSRAWSTPFADVAVEDHAVDRGTLLARVAAAVNPVYMQEKTGYLMMGKDWDLDWGVMIDATQMVDTGMATLDAFRLVVLVFSDEHGWLMVNMADSQAPASGESPEQDERRRQVFLFRDALAAMGKEDLFFRWIDMVQFEVTQPGGFTAERQEIVAKQVRDLFNEQGIDFDGVWKESVGTENLGGM